MNSFLLVLTSIIVISRFLGDTAFIKDYPHHVAVLYKNTPRCGGSIVSKNFVVTTAQCVFKIAPKDIQIRAGSDFSHTNGTVYSVNHIKIHPDFNEISLDFDVALLEVSDEIVYSENSRNVALWENASGYDYTNCNILAWNPDTNSIEVTKASMVAQEYCVDVYVTKDAPITNRMFCSQFVNKDFCENDIGGSLICHNNQLMGIRSWGYGCDFRDYPHVFTNLLTLKGFIEEYINDYSPVR